MKNITLLAIASLLFLCVSGSAQTQINSNEFNTTYHHNTPNSTYALICLNNNLPSAVIYSYRWGNGQWYTNTIAAYGSYMHWWTYETQTPVSPKFEIYFDADYTDFNAYKYYFLNRCQTSILDCGYASTYSFKWIIANNSFDLYDDNSCK